MSHVVQLFSKPAMERVAVILCAVIWVAALAATAKDVEIPRHLKLCNRRRSLDYTGCLRDAIQDAIPKFAKGFPELGIPVIDPLPTPFAEMVHENVLFSGRMTLRNVNTYGLTKVKILDVRSTVSQDWQRLEVDVAVPKSLVEGEYAVEGAMGVVKMDGKGFFNVSMEGIRTSWDISGPIKNDRWIIEHFVMLPEVEKMKVYFDDLFNGNRIINDAARNFVNQYWKSFYKALLPAAAAEWDKEMTDYVNRWFSIMSYSKIFPIASI